MMENELLKVEDLSVSFVTDEGEFRAVDRVSFSIGEGETLGLVGESGAGKSVTALSIPGLIPMPPGRMDGGRILFKGRDLLSLPRREMRTIRGRAVSTVFQEPLSSLSPLKRIGEQMVEAVRFHLEVSKKEAWDASRDWLQKVGIPDPEERLFAYPYQLSGGMQQRVMIATALMLSPDLVIADEPTTALDVTIQAQILALMREMKRSHAAMLLITHDLGVVWEMCDRVVVMYAARIVEEGPLERIFAAPAHPYTAGLLSSIPKLSGAGGRMKAIKGQVPSPFRYPSGCRFNDRCPHAFERCFYEEPGFVEVGEGHRAACFIAGGF